MVHHLEKFIPILELKNFLLCKRAVYNSLSLELQTPFNLQLKI